MSASLMSASPASRQPPTRNFRCTEPGCDASYLRKEHLNRHSKQHHQQSQTVCEHCGHAFSRSDILRRHQRLYHDDVTVGRSRALQACDHCHSRRTRCRGDSPCETCLSRGIPCTFTRKDDGQAQAIGTPNVNRSSDKGIETLENGARVPDDGSFATSTTQSLRQLRAEVSLEGNLDLWDMLRQYEQEYSGLDAAASLGEINMVDAPQESSTVNELYSSPDGSAKGLDIQRYVDDYFENSHRQWPLIHRPGFRPEAEPRFLVLSMVMMSLWTSGEDRAQAVAVQIHERFISVLQEQKDKWDASRAATTENRNITWPMGIYQSILLHVIFAMARSNPGGDAGGRASSSRPRWLPLAIHELLERLLKSCLRLGVFQYPKMLEQYDRVGFAFLTWEYVEEVKRFALNLFTVWTLCYGASSSSSSSSSSSPSAAGSRLRFPATELRFPLPESDYLWEAEAIGELISRREKELREGSGVKEEEEFWAANLGIGDVELAERWRDLANDKAQMGGGLRGGLLT